MTNTDPAGFDPEATGAFNVRSLTEKESAFLQRAEEEAERTAPMPKPLMILPTAPAGPSLVYVHSINGTQTLIDRHAPGATIENAEDKIRELMIARALLRHALHLVDKELNGL